MVGIYVAMSALVFLVHLGVIGLHFWFFYHINDDNISSVFRQDVYLFHAFISVTVVGHATDIVILEVTHTLRKPAVDQHLCNISFSQFISFKSSIVQTLIHTQSCCFCCCCCRFSRSSLDRGPAAERSGSSWLDDTRLPVLWESVSDGHRRLTGDIVPLFRRLSARPHPRLLLGRLQVETKDWLQRQGLPSPRLYFVPIIIIDTQPARRYASAL